MGYNVTVVVDIDGTLYTVTVFVSIDYDGTPEDYTCRGVAPVYSPETGLQIGNVTIQLAPNSILIGAELPQGSETKFSDCLGYTNGNPEGYDNYIRSAYPA